MGNTTEGTARDTLDGTKCYTGGRLSGRGLQLISTHLFFFPMLHYLLRVFVF